MVFVRKSMNNRELITLLRLQRLLLTVFVQAGSQPKSGNCNGSRFGYNKQATQVFIRTRYKHNSSQNGPIRQMTVVFYFDWLIIMDFYVSLPIETTNIIRFTTTHYYI